MKTSEEDKRKSLGFTVSLVFHALILLLFFFMAAWKEPNPPIPEYGIELSFGIQAKGKSNTPKEISAPEPAKVEEPVEEVLEQQSESPSEIAEETEPQPSQTESLEPINSASTKTETAPSTPPQEHVESQSAEVNKEETTKTDQPSEVTGQGNDGNDANDSPEENSTAEEDNGNDGDRPIDERALYGKKEGVSKQGSFLNLRGWAWDSKPKPDDTSNENGKIVFQITIDDRGDIIGIKTLESTVTPTVEKIYRDEVGKLTFTPTSENFSPAPTSKGEITFVIKSR